MPWTRPTSVPFRRLLAVLGRPLPGRWVRAGHSTLPASPEMAAARHLLRHLLGTQRFLKGDFARPQRDRNPVSWRGLPLPGCDPVGGHVRPALEHFDLDRMPGFKLIFCFQDACPGCHALPAFQRRRVVDAFRERLRRVRRSRDRVRGLRFRTPGEPHAGQSRPLRAGHFRAGHDAVTDRTAQVPELMRRYRSNGTPWISSW